MIRNHSKHALAGAVALLALFLAQLPAEPLAAQDSTGTEPANIQVVPDSDPKCRSVIVHEIAHLVDFVFREDLQPGGQAFASRLEAAYRAAKQAGLWTGKYANKNVGEYWAESVTFWLSPSEFAKHKPAGSDSKKLADYDPAAAKLIAEVFGAAALPSFCAPGASTSGQASQ